MKAVQTDRRLTEAYESARVEHFDDDSRYVFISDCHRGDGSLSDEFTRNENVYLHALAHYYDAGFSYVEVGDGDELWEHPHFRHIRDSHYDSFEAIKRFFDDGRFVLIWGNHNNYLRDRRYVEKNLHTYYHEHRQATVDFLPGIVPCEALLLKHRTTEQEILVLHGHQGDFTNDQAWIPTMLSLRYFWRHLHALGVQNPASPSRNAPKRHKIERNYNKWIAKNRRALICGHTHRLKYPRPDELPYLNAGSCVYPTSVTAIEITGGVVQLVRWRVVVGDGGVLHVERQVLRGPEPLARFDIR